MMLAHVINDVNDLMCCVQPQCELSLEDLLPATSYYLSIQTVAYWGQKRLKSPKGHFLFTTNTDTGKVCICLSLQR